MSLENLNLNLSIQKFISIPQYKLPKEKFRKCILFIIRIIPVSILCAGDIFLLLDTSTYVLDTQDSTSYVFLESFTIAVMFLDAIISRLGMILLILINIHQNKRHIKFIGILRDFENVSPKRQLSVEPRRYNFELLFVILHQYVFISLTYPFLANLKAYIPSVIYVTQSILLDITFIYLIHLIRHLATSFSTIPVTMLPIRDIDAFFQLSQKAQMILRMFNSCFKIVIAFIILCKFLDGCHGLFIAHSLFSILKMTPSNIFQGIGNIAWTVKNFTFIVYISNSSTELHRMVGYTL